MMGNGGEKEITQSTGIHHSSRVKVRSPQPFMNASFQISNFLIIDNI